MRISAPTSRRETIYTGGFTSRRKDIRMADKKLQDVFVTEITPQSTDFSRWYVDVVRKAELALDECVVRAPKAGRVLRVWAKEGEVLSSTPRQPALEFLIEGPRIVRAEVEQEYAQNVHVGQTARIQDDTRTGRSWTGKVVRVSPWYTHRRSILFEPLQFNDVRTIECIIRFEEEKPDVRIGQRMRVTLE